MITSHIFTYIFELFFTVHQQLYFLRFSYRDIIIIASSKNIITKFVVIFETL